MQNKVHFYEGCLWNPTGLCLQMVLFSEKCKELHLYLGRAKNWNLELARQVYHKSVSLSGSVTTGKTCPVKKNWLISLLYPPYHPKSQILNFPLARTAIVKASLHSLTNTAQKYMATKDLRTSNIYYDISFKQTENQISAYWQL